MGFYIRKSVSVGPFRFNLSKSGVGVSAGVKGFRVGSGPRGHYVHMGRGGLYYRATLPSPSIRSPGGATPTFTNPGSFERGPAPVIHYESAATGTIIDSSSAEIIADLNRNLAKWSLWPVAFTITAFIAHIAQGTYGWSAPFWQAVAATAIATAAAYWLDRIRKTTVLFFEMDAEAERRFEALHEAFARLSRSQLAWTIHTEQKTRDLKRNAGAGKSITRSQIRLTTGNPPWVKSNVSAPRISVGTRTLYFFPDKVLLVDRSSAGAVSYANLEVKVGSTRFVEDGAVPRDALQVDSTWTFVNKNGGPDRRFKNNRKLPIMLYESIDFSSDTGLRAKIELSLRGHGDEFREAVRTLAEPLPA